MHTSIREIKIGDFRPSSKKVRWNEEEKKRGRRNCNSGEIVIDQNCCYVTFSFPFLKKISRFFPFRTIEKEIVSFRARINQFRRLKLQFSRIRPSQNGIKWPRVPSRRTSFDRNSSLC